MMLCCVVNDDGSVDGGGKVELFNLTPFETYSSVHASVIELKVKCTPRRLVVIVGFFFSPLLRQFIGLDWLLHHLLVGTN